MLSTVPVATGVPQLSSNPTATAKLYLDFNGESGFYWDGGYNGWRFNVPATPAYGADADFATFSDVEQANIRQIWERVAEKFSPFDIDVTTIRPSSFADKGALHMIVGGNGSWFPDGNSGASQKGSFYLPTPNVAFAFSDKYAGNPKLVAEQIAHEAGRAFGLEWQSSFNASGGMTRMWSIGNSQIAPIMGNANYAARGLWWTGSTNLNVTQDDLALITGGNNGFGYRADDHGNTRATATAVNGSRSGVIERTTDVDYFSFTTGGGNVTINGAVAQYGAMLDLKLALYNANGTLIASADTATLGETLTANLSAGTYYVTVSGHGNIACYDNNGVHLGSGADLGQYTLTITGGSTTNPTPPPPTTPAPASGVTATATSSSQINLAWRDNSTNETGFEIDRATNASFTSGLATMTVGANTTSYSFTGLAAGTTYYFRVRATNDAGDSANSSTVYATTLAALTAPAPASGLTATAASSSQINLAWADNSSNETGFRIERAANASFTAGLTAVTVGANVRSYSATGLSAGTTYYFRVIAVNAAGNSPASNTAWATTTQPVTPPVSSLPAAPTDLKKSKHGKKTKLTWVDRATNEKGFRLEYSLDGVNWISLATVGANKNNYTHSMKNGETFYYRIQAYNASGTSDWVVLNP